MRLILEANVRLDQTPSALDIDTVESVHQDVADARVLEQRFERAKSENLVEYFLDQALPLLNRHRDPVIAQQALDHRSYLIPHAFLVERPQLIRRQRIQKPRMKLRFDLKPAIDTGCASICGRGGSSCTGIHKSDRLKALQLPNARPRPRWPQSLRQVSSLRLLCLRMTEKPCPTPARSDDRKQADGLY